MTTTTVTTRPGFFSRLRGAHTRRRTYKSHGGVSSGAGTTHHTTTRRRTFGRRRAAVQPTGVHHTHQRKPSIGDKISGALLKLKGSLTHRPGEKAAGTRRMRGHDGRGSHHATYY